MATLIPTVCECHNLELPPMEKDDRLNLSVRTGSASTLHKSLVFAYGGLTIGLELGSISILEVTKEFLSKVSNKKVKNMEHYLSGEFFYLDLIAKKWTRVSIPEGEPKPRPRLFHEICAAGNSLYVFGGLVLEEGSNENELVPSNELWEFNLETERWRLLHDGTGYKSSKEIPSPRFNYKMTVIHSLSFANKKDHFGIMIVGGKDKGSQPIYENAIYDIVAGSYLQENPYYLTTYPLPNDNNVSPFIYDRNNHQNVDYEKNLILTFPEELAFKKSRHGQSTSSEIFQRGLTGSETEESIVVYSPTKSDFKSRVVNPLSSFKIGKTIKQGKELPLSKFRTTSWRNSKSKKAFNQVIPYNLRFPCGGLFGQNLVITGFLPDDYNISVFLYNKPTARWSRLNLHCNHEYGSHRFWGGFSWQSHHKVVLIGNYVTSRTTSSIRYFSVMVTVSLPIANVLVTSELSKGYRDYAESRNLSSTLSDDDSLSSFSEDYFSTSSEQSLSDREEHVKIDGSNEGEDSQSGKVHRISFNDYVHYVAPKAKFTTIRSVFPAAAVTLGRNAFDRYGDLISDFELVSISGDRIPLSLRVLEERWGSFFTFLLSRAYVRAVDDFNKEKKDERTCECSISMNKSSENSLSQKGGICARNTANSSISSSSSELSFDRHSFNCKADLGLQYKISMAIPPGVRESKQAPKFRLPFQEAAVSTPTLTKEKPGSNVNESKPMNDSSTNDIFSTSIFSKSPLSRPPLASVSSAIDPHQKLAFESKNNEFENIFGLQFESLPPQMAVPAEPVPQVPYTQTSRSFSRKNSDDYNSPRSSLLYALRGISLHLSPRDSPSPRGSISSSIRNPSLLTNQLNLKVASPLIRNRRAKSLDSSSDASGKINLYQLEMSNAKEPLNNTDRKANATSSSIFDDSKNISSYNSALSYTNSTNYEVDNKKSEKREKNRLEASRNMLLDFDKLEKDDLIMEPSLIPRKLYMPFASNTLKAFGEYLYTGQVGNKWLFTPTALECLALARFMKVPLLYDLVSEVLFGIIGRKEVHIIREGKKLKNRYNKLLLLTHSLSNLKFPLDEYEGFMNTVDDGFYDIALLKRTSEIHRNSAYSNNSSKKKKSINSIGSLRLGLDSLERVSSQEDLEDSFHSLSKTAKEPDEKFESPKATTKLPAGAESSCRPKLDSDLGNDLDHVDSEAPESSNRNTIAELGELSSSSEGDDDDESKFGLLDVYDNQSINMGPKARSIFDEPGAEMYASKIFEENRDDYSDNCSGERQLFLTLAELSTAEGPIPSNEVIDQIFEMGTLTRDMKLMLRATNAQQMSEILQQSRDELGQAILELEKQYERQLALETLKSKDHHVSKIHSVSGDESSLYRVGSGSSVSTNVTGGGLRKSLTNIQHPSSSLLGQKVFSLARFEPMKKSKSKDSSKDLDKRLAKLVKNDEKLRKKEEKKEMNRISAEEKKIRKQLLMKGRNVTSTSTNSGKKIHNYFSHFGKNRHSESPSKDPSILSRTASDTESVHSRSSKKSKDSKEKFKFVK